MSHHCAETKEHVMGPHHMCNLPRQAEITYQSQIKICQGHTKNFKGTILSKEATGKPAKVLSICLIPYKSYRKEN